MTVQLYRLIGQFDNAYIGQFVFTDNDSDIVIGFISKVTSTYIDVCLFEPISNEQFIEMTKNVHTIKLADIIPDWISKLEAIFEENPNIKIQWINALNQ